jgi:hypothetical protein
MCINLSAKAGYSITSSAIATTLAGNSGPSDFADQGKAPARRKADMTTVSATR